MKERIYIKTKNSGISLNVILKAHKNYCIENSIPFRELDLSIFNVFHYLYIGFLGSYRNIDLIFIGPLYFHSIFASKSIIILHDFGSLSSSKYYKLIIRFYSIFFKKRTLLCVSDQTKQELKDILGIENGIVLRNFNRFSNHNLTALVKKKKSFSLINILVFNQTKNKNLEYILCNLNNNEKYNLFIIGTYNIEYFSNILDNKGLSYKFYNNIDDNSLTKLYLQSSLILFLSTYEGFGMPIIEGQSFGLPVIASNLSVFQNEVIRDSAIYVDISKNANLNTYIDHVVSNYFYYVELSLYNASLFSYSNYFNTFNSILLSKK